MKRSCKISKLWFILFVTRCDSVLLYRFRATTINVEYIIEPQAPLLLDKPRDCNDKNTKTPSEQPRDTYNMAGNCVNDKTPNVWNTTVSYVPLSIVAALSTEKRMFSRTTKTLPDHLKERHFIVYTHNTVNFNFKLSIQCKFCGCFLTAQTWNAVSGAKS